MNIIKGEYTVYTENEINKVISQPFSTELDEFLQNYLKFVHKDHRLKFSDYPNLPFVLNTTLEKELQFRRASYRVVKALLKSKKQLDILEIGPWNSWLTPLLCKNENNVVAMDYFDDHINGLGSRIHHKEPKWISIQGNLEDPEFLNKTFDLIIFNHNLQFFTQPLTILKKYQKLLNKNGTLLLLGLTIFSSSVQKSSEVASLIQKYREEFNVALFFRPCKAYLDKQDMLELENNGFEFFPYRVSWIRRIASQILKKRTSFYAIYEGVRNPK